MLQKLVFMVKQIDKAEFRPTPALYMYNTYSLEVETGRFEDIFQTHPARDFL